MDKTLFKYDIEAWLRSIKIKCKATTYSNYQYTVRSRIEPKFSNLKKQFITTDLVNSFTMELLNEGLCPKTVKDILVILKQILVFSNVDIKFAMPKINKKEIQILLPFEQISLEKYLFENINLNTAGIMICLYMGLRIGELCALRWENIDLKDKKIKIRNTITRIKNNDPTKKNKTVVLIDSPKSSCSIREIPIPDFMIPILKSIRGNIDPNCFFLTGNIKFLESRTFFSRYKNILKKINLSSYNFHVLRHTFATRCVEQGFDPKLLSEILGHSNVKITLDRYVHPSYESKVRMMNQMKPLYENKKHN